MYLLTVEHGKGTGRTVTSREFAEDDQSIQDALDAAYREGKRFGATAIIWCRETRGAISGMVVTRNGREVYGPRQSIANGNDRKRVANLGAPVYALQTPADEARGSRDG